MAFSKVTKEIEPLSSGWDKFNDLIDDLLSVASGLGASQVGVEDSAGNMVAINVEGALAEIYTALGAVNIAHMLDEDPATTTALVWGYKSGLVRLDNVITSVAAGTINLTDDATNYIEVDSSGVVSKSTTGFSSGKIPIREITTSGGSQTASIDKRTLLQVGDMPLPVAKGGTGAATLTDHGILLGSGTGVITPLAVATNGQLPIGSTGADPVVATLTGTANQIAITNGAGSITISIPTAAVLIFANEGLRILDSNGSHNLKIIPISDLTAVRELRIATGDADRTLIINGDSTLDQDTSVSSTPTFASLVLSGAAPAAPVANTLYRDLIVKGWCQFDGTGTSHIVGDVNVASLTDLGVGMWTVVWETDFADTTGITVATADITVGGSTGYFATAKTATAGISSVYVRRNDGNLSDVGTVNVLAMGEQ